LFDRRRPKANKSSSDGRATEATRKKKKTDTNPVATYELAADVTGAVTSLDRNGRLVCAKQAKPHAPTENGIEMNTVASTSGENSNVSPAQEDSKPQSPNNTQVDKKRDARTAQHEAEKTAPGDGRGANGKVGKGRGGVVEEERGVCDDNRVYANAARPGTAPLASSSSASAAAAAAGPRQALDAVCTSINDFTVIDNELYNYNS